MRRKILLLLLLLTFVLGCRVADWLAAGTPYPTPRSRTPTAGPSLAAPSRAPSPQTSNTTVPTPTNPPAGTLLPAPTLIAPAPGTQLAPLSRIQFEWTWTRPLAPNEYFDVQIAKDNPANMASIGCTRGPNFAYTLPGAGTFFWRVLVKSGAATPPVCAAQNDVSLPSEARPVIAQISAPTLPPVNPTATSILPTRPQPTQAQPTATNPQPTATQRPQPTPTTRPYP